MSSGSSKRSDLDSEESEDPAVIYQVTKLVVAQGRVLEVPPRPLPGDARVPAGGMISTRSRPERAAVLGKLRPRSS
ncbi:MAG TPA: hypothetical protein VFY92_12490 [Hyphomicrobiaceae bacterium]|nr:hypothetical protein [Hyphomicrobiaceae bacterium]